MIEKILIKRKIEQFHDKLLKYYNFAQNPSIIMVLTNKKRQFYIAQKALSNT